MPIRPENRDRYPANWSQIRANILCRARHRCERCGVPNRVWRWTDDNGQDHWTSDEMRVETLTTVDEVKVSRIVLTVAHTKDPDPANCHPSNLEALCQRCHNRLDAPMRARNAAATRHARKASGDLFGNGA